MEWTREVFEGKCRAHRCACIWGSAKRTVGDLRGSCHAGRGPPHSSAARGLRGKGCAALALEKRARGAPPSFVCCVKPCIAHALSVSIMRKTSNPCEGWHGSSARTPSGAIRETGSAKGQGWELFGAQARQHRMQGLRQPMHTPEGDSKAPVGVARATQKNGGCQQQQSGNAGPSGTPNVSLDSGWNNALELQQCQPMGAEWAGGVGWARGIPRTRSSGRCPRRHCIS